MLLVFGGLFLLLIGLLLIVSDLEHRRHRKYEQYFCMAHMDSKASSVHCAKG